MLSLSPSHAPSLSPSHALSLSPSWAPSPSPSCIQCPELDDINNDSDESDTGAPELWDPHAGLKLSELDGHVSDANMEMEEDLPPGGEEEVRASMVEMTGMISSAGR